MSILNLHSARAYAAPIAEGYTLANGRFLAADDPANEDGVDNVVFDLFRNDEFSGTFVIWEQENGTLYGEY